MSPTPPPDQPAKLIDVEHSRRMAAGISDPCVPLVDDETKGKIPVPIDSLEIAARAAGWAPSAVTAPFVLTCARRFIETAGMLGLLPSAPEGDPYLDLKWSTWRVVISSFGFPAWRELATLLVARVPGCPFDPEQPIEDWYETAIKARQSSGVPLSLPRIPWQAWCGAARAGFDAFYLREVVLWHVVRHAFVSADGERINVIYSGTGVTHPLTSLTDVFTAPIYSMFKTHLRLPGAGGKKVPDHLGLACADVIPKLSPQRLLRQRRPLTLDPHIMPGPGVRLRWCATEDPYFEHHCALEGIAVCVDGTPEVLDLADQEAADVLTWDWISGKAEDHAVADRQRQWLAALPDVAPDGRPSQILQAAFPNLKFIDDDHACLLDAVMVCDLIRRRDHGEGTLLSREFPLLAILPYTPTVEGSTNTGKTALVEVIARAFHPEIEVKTITDTSAPTKRTIAAIIDAFGFVALDEWRMPVEGSDHLLAHSGMQSLCTGKSVGMGKVLSNEDNSVRLASSIVLNAKYLPMPDDLLLRSVYLWVDPRGNGGDPKEIAARWNAISSGQVSLNLRLSALRMLDQWEGIDDLRGYAPNNDQWRMVGHRVCAARICAAVNGIGMDEALGRIDRAVATQVAQHQQLTQAAIESGLVARYENPITATLDLAVLFESVPPNVDPKHRADQLITLAKTAINLTTTRGKAGTFGPGGLAKAFADFIRARNTALSGKPNSEVYAYLLGPKFQGLSDKDVALRIGQALRGACPMIGSRWALPDLFGIDGWHITRVEGSDDSKRFYSLDRNPTP